MVRVPLKQGYRGCQNAHPTDSITVTLPGASALVVSDCQVVTDLMVNPAEIRQGSHLEAGGQTRNRRRSGERRHCWR